jgi:ERCC4-type nuclease
MGIKTKVKKLNVGDYSFIVDGKSYENILTVERKNSLTELSGNFGIGRKRFENEFIRATETGAKVILLVEDAKAKQKMILRRELDADKSLTSAERHKKTWRSDFPAVSMINSIASWKERYNLDVLFVDKKDTAKIILESFKLFLAKYDMNIPHLTDESPQ